MNEKTKARRAELLNLLVEAMEVDPEPLLRDLDDMGFGIVDREQLWRVLRMSRAQTHKARRERDRAIARLADIVDFDGVSHDDPCCPCDDTCRCENIRDVNELLMSVKAAKPSKHGRQMSGARQDNWLEDRKRDREDAVAWRTLMASAHSAGLASMSLRELADLLLGLVADAARWREHMAAIKASGREPAGIMADQEGRSECVYYHQGKPSGDCGGDGHFMCAVCAKKVAE